MRTTAPKPPVWALFLSRAPEAKRTVRPPKQVAGLPQSRLAEMPASDRCLARCARLYSRLYRAVAADKAANETFTLHDYLHEAIERAAHDPEAQAIAGDADFVSYVVTTARKRYNHAVHAQKGRLTEYKDNYRPHSEGQD